MEQLFQIEPFKNARAHEIPQMLSDHPSDQNRIDALTKHMSANTSTFGKYSRDRASATAFSVPKNSPVVFLR